MHQISGHSPHLLEVNRLFSNTGNSFLWAILLFLQDLQYESTPSPGHNGGPHIGACLILSEQRSATTNVTPPSLPTREPSPSVNAIQPAKPSVNPKATPQPQAEAIERGASLAHATKIRAVREKRFIKAQSCSTQVANLSKICPSDCFGGFQSGGLKFGKICQNLSENYRFSNFDKFGQIWGFGRF